MLLWLSAAHATLKNCRISAATERLFLSCALRQMGQLAQNNLKQRIKLLSVKPYETVFSHVASLCIT